MNTDLLKFPLGGDTLFLPQKDEISKGDCPFAAGKAVVCSLWLSVSIAPVFSMSAPVDVINWV